MDAFRLFWKIESADEGRHEVLLTLASEAPDRSGEILDYSSSKPHFIEWVKSQHRDSGGKSYGNVRRMHQMQAVGKLAKVWFDDAAKRVKGIAKVTDPQTWKDIIEGVLTGASIGGRYVKRGIGGDSRRYTAAPFEVSLVDRSCIPDAAGLEVLRSDGVLEFVKFESSVKEFTDRPASALPRQGETGEQPEWGDLEAAPKDPFECDVPQNYRRSGVEQDEGGEGDAYLDDRKGAKQAADKEPYGNVEYADPGYQADKKKRYPIDTEEHVRAAWSYINMPKNSGKYSSGELAGVKAKIRAAAKKHGIEISKAQSPSAEAWNSELQELFMEELEKIEFDLEKGAKKKASQRLNEIRDMAKAHYTALDGALDGVSKGIAGPDSAQTEGNSMQSRSGEMNDQPKPAISFNPQVPTSIGKLAKSLGVTEEKLKKAVDEVNGAPGSVTLSDVQEVVEKTVTDILEHIFGAGKTVQNDAVRTVVSGTAVSRDQDGRAEHAAKAAEPADDLPPAPGIDPRMEAVYAAGRALKAQGAGAMDDGTHQAIARVAGHR